MLGVFMGTFDFQRLKKGWRSELVARTEIGEFTGGICNPRTMANLDSLGLGPKEKIRIGRKICYPTDVLIRWIEDRSNQKSNARH
jgi:hypothetical protein